jgi:hypothetical protein
MLPILEQAGRTRARFIENVLVVYNFAHSYEANVSRREEIEHERNVADRIRAKRKYARLEAL